jgi:hypothetical protein
MIGQTTDPLFFLLSLPSIESFVADNTPEHHFAPFKSFGQRTGDHRSWPHRRNEYPTVCLSAQTAFLSLSNTGSWSIPLLITNRS